MLAGMKPTCSLRGTSQKLTPEAGTQNFHPAIATDQSQGTQSSAALAGCNAACSVLWRTIDHGRRPVVAQLAGKLPGLAGEHQVPGEGHRQHHWA